MAQGFDGREHSMNEFPFAERCRHYMIPYQCDWCVTDLARGLPVEPHVRERIEAFHASHVAPPARPVARRRAKRIARARHPQRRRDRASQRSGTEIRIAPKRSSVVSPVFGKTFDPKRGRDQTQPALPAHLRI